MGGVQNVPLGEHVGWEGRSEIPENINVKGVSGKDAVKGKASHVRATVALDEVVREYFSPESVRAQIRALRESPDHRAAHGQTHPRRAAVNWEQYGGSSVSCIIRWFLVGLRAFGGVGQDFCLLVFAVGRKRQDLGSDGGLEGLSSSAGSQGWLQPP